LHPEEAARGRRKAAKVEGKKPQTPAGIYREEEEEAWASKGMVQSNLPG
jgi:hypothetical protein